MKFQDFNLLKSLLKAVEQEGYEQPTPIQEQAIPPVLDGKDVLGCAQTGTGKTAAFALPILHNLVTQPKTGRGKGGTRVLVLTPTRELAAQVGQSFETYGKNTRIRTVTIFGGVSQVPQERALRRSPQVVVATPGRLLDLVNQRIISLSDIEVFVLDEADRMLDMGFINDIRKVVSMLPEKRQSLFFSATLPDDITTLADSILSDNPVVVKVDSPTSTVDLIAQQLCFVEKKEKIELLLHFLSQSVVSRALVFTRTKHGADTVVRKLSKAGIIAKAIHGNKTQGARTRALEGFKNGQTPVLVATDIAARGIDVDNISHVFNFDLPNEPETYIHRIGRTGRAGTSGIAIAFCAKDERPYLRAIEQLMHAHICRMEDYPHQSSSPAPAPTNLQAKQKHTRPNYPKTDSRRKQGWRTHGRSPQNRATGHDRPRHGSGQRHPSSGTGRSTKTA